MLGLFISSTFVNRIVLKPSLEICQIYWKPILNGTQLGCPENLQKNAKKTFHLLQCSDALQSSPLTEAAELLDLLNHIEFEGLLFAHDKLAERQVKNILNIGTSPDLKFPLF